MVSSSLSFRRYVSIFSIVSSPCPRVSRAWKWDEGHRLKGPWLRKTRLETGIVEGLLWTTPISIAAMIQLTWIGKMSCIYLRYQISPLMIPALKLLQLASSGQRVREGPLLLIDNLHKGRSLENIFWYSIAFDMFSSFHNVYIVNLYILRLNWVSSMKVYSLDQLLMKTKKDPTLSKRRNDERDLLYDIFHWNVLNSKN